MALKLIYAVYCISGFVYGWLSRFVYGDIILNYSVILFHYQFRIKFMIKSWTLWELNILRKIHVVCDWIVSYFQNQIFGCGPLDPHHVVQEKGSLWRPHIHGPRSPSRACVRQLRHVWQLRHQRAGPVGEVPPQLIVQTQRCDHFTTILTRTWILGSCVKLKRQCDKGLSILL